ncbi:MAG TPA: cytochrome ubiquinol oxidase subunit I [Phycisphaerae bacterium]|nr:cytochrome ubiquinol oxidase subunit I [Phycisphaerae bacterium]
MDVLLLSRLQFALTIAFHYLFPPLSIGLGVILVIMEAAYLKTKSPLYRRMTRFWVGVFGLIFAMGVATGIVMEFQFGTNWSTYSRFVGDVFGSALAAEGIFAFFLESGFLAILLFGWGKVRDGTHFLATVLVCVGAHFSAVWIVVANSWQQTPAGHHIVQHGEGVRAEITDFWALVFNPSSMDRLSHVILGAWQAGAFLVLSVGAYYLLKHRHEDFAKASMKIALVVAVIGSVGQLVTGHSSALGVAENQPAKLAAMEGHYAESAAADLYMFGWVDEQAEQVRYGVKLPRMLSWMVHGDRQRAIVGLSAFARGDRPPVNAVFQAYHAMVGIGTGLIGLSVVGLLMWWRGALWRARWLLGVFVIAVLGPQAANQLGWLVAELGRQPWVVYNLLRTSDAFSPVLSSSDVAASLVMFLVVYALLFALFIYLLDHKIRKGPADGPAESGRHLA